MPQLTDPRWESACQIRAKGGDVAASYREAGFTGNPSAATMFFKRPHIIQRINEIQQERYTNERKVTEIAVKKAGLEESWIIERLIYGIEISLRGEPILDAQGRPTGKHGKRNLNAFAKLLGIATDIKGMRIFKHEIGAPGDFARMSDQELNDTLLEQSRALGLPDEAVLPLLIEHKPDGESV